MQAKTGDRDLYKLRVMFRWICNNITHEGETTLQSTDPHKVLATGQTTCLGFANFFVQLADKCGMGDKVMTVEGFCKGQQYTLPFQIDEPNHAWCMLKVEDEWYLCDPTWAAGGYGNGDHFDREFDDFWFLTAPELFAYTHFPRDKDMLLLPPNSRFGFQTFLSTPSLHSQFFKLGLRLASTVDAVLQCQADTLNFYWEYTGNTHPAILPKLYPWSGATRSCSALENCVLIQHGQKDKDTRRARFCVSLPKPGTYKLELYGKPPGTDGTYKPLLWGYRIVRTGSANRVPPNALPLQYPEMYEPYNSAGVWVWKPATPYIPLDEKTQWKISMNTMADHVEYAIIRCNHQWAELLRENSGGPFFVADFQPTTLPVEVLVTHKGDGKSVRTVLRYGQRPAGNSVYLSPRCAMYKVGISIDNRLMKNTAPPYNPSSLWINCPDDVTVSPVLEDASGLELEDHVLINGTTSQFQMKVCGPKPGLYTLKLFAATTEQTQLLGICSLPLELTHMHIGPSLVRQTGTCTVETPVQRQLESGKPTRFRIKIPGANTAVIINASRRLYLEKLNDDLFIGEFTLQPCPHTMVGANQDPAETSLAIMLKYVVK
jgi:hypothetical protein